MESRITLQDIQEATNDIFSKVNMYFKERKVDLWRWCTTANSLIEYTIPSKNNCSSKECKNCREVESILKQEIDKRIKVNNYMKNYRVVIETEASGKKWYYVQRRYLFCFWHYLREARDISMYAYKIGWHSLEEADSHIQSDINLRYEINQKKIIKREYINK